jgi:Na+-transporting NADH:ubiquinone oxidoreductase subunit A
LPQKECLDMKIRLRRGLNIKIAGAPKQVIEDVAPVSSLGLLGPDLRGARPSFKVEVGERVSAGQAVFVDRRRPEIIFTAPGSGTIVAINRGRHARNVLVIALDGDAVETFERPKAEPSRDDIRCLLLKAGLWPAFLTRPFGRIPDPDARPDALFVTAMDTNPLAADARVVLAVEQESFASGLDALTRLTDGAVFVCQAPGDPLCDESKERIQCVHFDGPHPAGLAGTHIHRLAPVGNGRVVWQIHYQDVIAIGHLLEMGKLSAERIVALGGPGVRNPKLLRTMIGANLGDLTNGELIDGGFRVVSGSPLSGCETQYLGRYHTQVSVLPITPEPSGLPILSRLLGRSRNVPSPLIPLTSFERVSALDIAPVPLLRALSTGDSEAAERLGCLQLIEEDLALFSYICASKSDYGVHLRSVLDEIEGEA